jgi:hypothetical protein
MALQDIFKNDLALMMKETGSLVSYNGFTTYGVLSHDPTEVLSLNSKQYSVQDTSLTLTIATGSIGKIKNNETLQVDNTTYQIYKYIIQDDGLDTKIWLSGVN